MTLEHKAHSVRSNLQELTTDDSSCVWFVSWMYSGLAPSKLYLPAYTHPSVT